MRFLRSAQKKVFLDCSRLYLAIFPTLLSSVKNLSLLSIAWNSPTLCVERRNDQTVLQMQLRLEMYGVRLRPSRETLLKLFVRGTWTLSEWTSSRGRFQRESGSDHALCAH